jgi:uncharacterized protein
VSEAPRAEGDVGRPFAPSPYVRTVARDDGWATYHSLFGNLTLLDRAGTEILEALRGGGTIDDLWSRLPMYSPRALRSFANDLVIRGFLTPTGTDEYCFVQEDESARREHLRSGYLVRALQLVLDKRCNYRCSYCFMDFAPNALPVLGQSDAAGRSGVMTTDVAGAAMREVIGVLKRNGNDVLNVEFFGGEPLMNAPVIGWVLETFGNEYDGVPILYSITTNGSLISEATARMFRRYGVTVTVSVDLPCQVDGAPRTVAKVGTRVERQLGILRDQANALTINAVISQSTIDLFDGRRLLDFASAYNAQMVGLILDLDLRFYKNPINRERAVRILLETSRYGREIGLPVGGYWHLIFDQITGQQAINLRSGYKTCPATGCKITVEPDGSICACECTHGELGEITALDEVLASGAYADYALQAYRQAPECAGCEIEGFCSGVCMGSLESTYERLDVVEAGACDIFRTVTRSLISEMPRSEIPEDLRLAHYTQ